MLIQVVVNNKYVGHFIMVAYYLFTMFQGQWALSIQPAAFQLRAGR